jgi:hypothetical protein
MSDQHKVAEANISKCSRAETAPATNALANISKCSPAGSGNARLSRLSYMANIGEHWRTSQRVCSRTHMSPPYKGGTVFAYRRKKERFFFGRQPFLLARSTQRGGSRRNRRFGFRHGPNVRLLICRSPAKPLRSLAYIFHVADVSRPWSGGDMQNMLPQAPVKLSIRSEPDARVRQLKRAFQRCLKRRPMMLEKTAMERAARLTARAEAATLDPDASVDDI